MSRFPIDRSRVREVVVVRQDRSCPACEAKMHVHSERVRTIHTLQGPMRLSVELLQCRNKECGSTKTVPAEQEAEYAMPRWGIGWDVFCWMGQRRFARHWSVCQIRHELADSYDIPLSDDAIEDHLASYQNMVAARHQDLGQMKLAYRGARKIVLTIDGLQPEKGHETLYVVREVTRNRVWFAEPLLSGTAAEIRKLFIRAKDLAQTLRLERRALDFGQAGRLSQVRGQGISRGAAPVLRKPLLSRLGQASSRPGQHGEDENAGKNPGFEGLGGSNPRRAASSRATIVGQSETDVVAGRSERQRGARLLQRCAWHSERQSRRSRSSGRTANARSVGRRAEVASTRRFVRESWSSDRSAGAIEGIYRSWRGGSAKTFHSRSAIHPTCASRDEIADR